jgi:hypothetical protein
MKDVLPSADDIVIRGKRVYDEKIRATLEPSHKGQIALINIDTGEFEVDRDHFAALRRAQARWPNTVFYAVRVGYPTFGRIGGRWKRSVNLSIDVVDGGAVKIQPLPLGFRPQPSLS